MDRLPSLINLDLRGVDVSSTLYLVCNLEVEQLSHLFLICEVTARTWDGVFRWLDIQVVQFSSIMHLFDYVDALYFCHIKKIDIDAVVGTTLWYIWRFRNDNVFAGGKFKRGDILDSICEFSFLQFSNINRNCSFNWTCWLQCPVKLFVIVCFF